MPMLYTSLGKFLLVPSSINSGAVYGAVPTWFLSLELSNDTKLLFGCAKTDRNRNWLAQNRQILQHIH